MTSPPPKGSLPHGWIVKASRHYPDRVYYFNVFTGCSVWECPELESPEITTEKVQEASTTDENSHNKDCKIPKKLNTDIDPPKSKENLKLIALPSTSSQSKPSTVSSPISKKSMKPNTPPTAIVAPVIQKEKQELSTDKKLKKMSNWMKEKTKKIKEGKKMKKLSPLNRTPSVETEISHLRQPNSADIVAEKNPVSIETMDAQRADDTDFINDIEMQDVSVDLLDDLTEKNETVFDISASYYIVVDTNILVGEMNLLSELSDTPLGKCGPPHIFIPWVVIEELDYLKSQRNSCPKTASKAAQAIRYLNSVLLKHPRFHGQSPAEAEEWAKAYSKCNDDKILECCMALQSKMPPQKVLLLTNDKNLMNKALICKIVVYNFESLLKEVEPDLCFKYEEIKKKKLKKKEKITEESDTFSPCLNLPEEQRLQDELNIYKRKIHSNMSQARLLLRQILTKFFKEEMFNAYGSIWEKFNISTKLLPEVLAGIVNGYWKAVFYEFFSEKNKRNLELLLSKARRPEGFLGDKEECLVILSAIDDVFHQLQKKREHLGIPKSRNKIQDFRVACVNAFVDLSRSESSIREMEEKSIHALLDINWCAINQLCGPILDYYKVSHNFVYEKRNEPYSDHEVRRIMVDLYPGVNKFRSLLQSILDAVKNCKPIETPIKNLRRALLEFIPSLKLKQNPISQAQFPFFTIAALDRFFNCPQKREMIENGFKQIELFHTKLGEVLQIIYQTNRKSEIPVFENMICD